MESCNPDHSYPMHHANGMAGTLPEVDEKRDLVVEAHTFLLLYASIITPYLQYAAHVICTPN